jgi:hypothetical protein
MDVQYFSRLACVLRVAVVTPPSSERSHGFRFEETLEMRLQRFGSSIAKTLRFKTYCSSKITGPTVVHRRRCWTGAIAASHARERLWLG